ncbi:hypothetical protein HPP92_007688 [Vanilla planifolia]|uniref:Uncharacterized protein n=1 Tax=Vanilla planifolia TaxID=51239 RepID=A0A835VBG9_VANPL|nr:hypothetical protein HPP92_007688 [Vanilla planifolia]
MQREGSVSARWATTSERANSAVERSESYILDRPRETSQPISPEENAVAGTDGQALAPERGAFFGLMRFEKALYLNFSKTCTALGTRHPKVSPKSLTCSKQRSIHFK